MTPKDHTSDSEDTEAAATKRFMLGGFGRGERAYQRYVRYVDWLRRRNGITEQTIDPREWIGYILTPKWKEKPNEYPK